VIRLLLDPNTDEYLRNGNAHIVNHIKAQASLTICGCVRCSRELYSERTNAQATKTFLYWHISATLTELAV